MALNQDFLLGFVSGTVVGAVGYRLYEQNSGQLQRLLHGIVSFLSPCVLPLVPAYLGQLTAIAVAGSAVGRPAVALARGPSRARVRRRVRAVFTVLGRHRHVRRRTAGRLPAGAARRSAGSC